MFTISHQIPIIDVGEGAEHIDDCLAILAEAGHLNRLVTVMYGDSGESRTGHLRQSLAFDGPSGYWLD